MGLRGDLKAETESEIIAAHEAFANGISCNKNTENSNMANAVYVKNMTRQLTTLRGVFKKRPNFLNSAPTGTESALWLMSAPSIRFWQQTAICPISLWALIVELYLLNWAHAHLFMGLLTMKEIEEQRVCVKFCCNLGKNFTETFQLLNQAYGEDSMSRTQCYEWFKCFKENRMLVGEDPRPGWPSTSTNNDHVMRVCAVIHGNSRLTVWEVADEAGISIGSCHQIFTEKLQMHHVSAKFVPCLSTYNQKENRVEIGQELLANANGNENFKNVIIGMRCGFMGMMLKPRCSQHSGWGKGLLDQK